MATAAKFRIDVAIHDLLMNSVGGRPARARELTLPGPIFPQFPERLNDPGSESLFGEWNCCTGQNNLIIRTDRTVARCFPMYGSNLRPGKHRPAKIRSGAAVGHEVDLAASMFFNVEPQPGVLLQRCPGDRVALVERY
jgi:hypothetical protein